MLRPWLDLEAVYPLKTAVTWYIPEKGTRWLPSGTWLSSYPLPLAGRLPVVVHESVALSGITKILQTQSLSFSSQMKVVTNEDEGRQHLQDLVEKGFRIHSDYRLPQDWFPASAYLVDPDLFENLNNKSMLEQWVPPGFYPERFPITLRELEERDPFPFPYVIKAISNYGSGGGIDVVICRNTEEKRAAMAYFKEEEKVMVEMWVPDSRLFCVQGAILKDGSYLALGSSEQICDAQGKPQGNWVDEESDIGGEGAALTEKIIGKAGAAGYRGFAGIDILKAADGTLKVIDLNFRSCNSTRGLLFREALKREWHWDCITVRGLVFRGDAETFLKTMTAATAKKSVFPWGLQICGDQLRTTVLCGAGSRQEAAGQFDRLAQSLAG